MVDTASKTGFISQIIGPVLDIEFPNGELPKIYNALVIETTDGDAITDGHAMCWLLLGQLMVSLAALRSQAQIRQLVRKFPSSSFIGLVASPKTCPKNPCAHN